MDKGDGLYKEQGAGDQGMMFGYACDETPELMPMPILFAHKLCQRLSEVRKNGSVDFLRPDGKTQVTVEYENGTPKRVDAIVVATQHTPDVESEVLREAVINSVIKKVIPAHMIDGDTRYYINPTGRFVVGGPMGDCGLTGRKIIVDTYGGQGSHGGGASPARTRPRSTAAPPTWPGTWPRTLSPPDSPNAARSRSPTASAWPSRCPSWWTPRAPERSPNQRIKEIIRECFDLRPAAIIEYLDLLRPIYRKTACYGHFGRNEPEFTWEHTNMADTMRAKAGI